MLDPHASWGTPVSGSPAKYVELPSLGRVTVVGSVQKMTTEGKAHIADVSIIRNMLPHIIGLDKTIIWSLSRKPEMK